MRRFLLALLRQRFSRISLPANHDRLIEKGQGTICLVVPSAGIILQALVESIARRLGQSITPRYVTAEALQSNSNGASHSSPNWLWVDINDQHALSLLAADRGSVPIRVFALSIFERRGPIHSNPRYSFNALQNLMFFVLCRFSALVVGAPIDLKNTPHLSASRLYRLIRLELFRNLRIVRGVPFQSVRVQEESALSGAEFERELSLIATKQRISIPKTRALASREFRRVVANPVRPFYAIASFVSRIIIRQLFSEVHTVGLERFVAAARDQTVVLVPMHRSHLDYILVSYKLYESKVNPPVVAAGINLSFWPIGYIIRSLGAYFVKRNARHDRIHSLILKRYVTYLVKRGHLQEFFIEGGRSRSGRMRSPKVGLLSVMVEACLKGLRKDIAFVPLSISYETVVEDRALAEENSGRKKQRESLWSLLSAHRIFRKQYGEVVLHFGRPLSLAQVVKSGEVAASAKRADSRPIVRELAQVLTRRIRAQSSISLSGLIYTALMCSPRYGLKRAEIEHSIRRLAEFARLARVVESDVGDFTPSLGRFLEGSEHALDDIIRGGVVARGTVHGEEMYYIPGQKRFVAEFYKNTLLHLFFPVAALAASQLMHGEVSERDVHGLHRIFEHDLLLFSEEEFTVEMHNTIQLLEEHGILTRAQDSKLRFSQDATDLRLANLLLGPLQSILWVYRALSRINAGEPGAPISVKSFMKQTQTEYRLAAYLADGDTSRTEASSQSAVTSSLEILSHLGVLRLTEGSANNSDTVEVLKAEVPELNFIERLECAIREGACAPGLPVGPYGAEGPRE